MCYTFCKPKTLSTASAKRKLYIYCSTANHFAKAKGCMLGNVHLSYSDYFNDPFDCKYGDPFSLNWIPSQPAKQLSNLICSYMLRCDREIYSLWMRITKDVLRNFSDDQMIALNQIIETASSLVKDEPEKVAIHKIPMLIEQDFQKMNPAVGFSYKIACFSEKADSTLMWAYYAGGHRGVCVEFDLSLLDESCPEHASILSSISPVRYSQIRPDDNYSTCSDSFFVKSLDWKHEKEWRLVCATDKNDIQFPCVSGVYLGALFEKNNELDKRDILYYSQKTGIPIYQMKLDIKHYRLYPEKITI